jgi:HEAT repeat protein
MQLQLSAGSHKLEAASEELSQLTRKPCNRKVVMSTPGALACIVNMLSKPDAAVARYAAAAVQNLAIEPEHCQSLVTAGCVQPLLQLLQAPVEQEAVLAAAAGALSNLACETQHCDMMAASPGCVQRLVQLLSHSSCVVREAAASVLGKLAWEPELCRPIAGEVVVIVDAVPCCFQRQQCALLCAAVAYAAWLGLVFLC